MVDTVDMVDTAVDTAVMEVTVLDTAMVDTVARDPLMPKPMPGTAVDTEDTDMEVMVDTDMEVMVDTDMEVTDVAMPVMEVTVLDTAMVDTVARDPLMPGT